MIEGSLQSFHFQPSFSVEADPEFPGDGDWRCLVHGFDRDGRVMATFESRWGTPCVYLITTREGNRWVGMVAAGGLGGATGAFACPNPTNLCVLVDGLGYLLDVEDPLAGAVAAHDQVHQVMAAVSPSLLLLARFIDIVAVGRRGIAWRSNRLCVDGLQIQSVTPEAITCAGDNLGGPPTIQMDPNTGEWIGGSQLQSGWPAD